MADIEIVIRTRNAHIPADLRTKLAERLERAGRFGVPLTRIDAEVATERNPRLSERAHEVELTCRGKGPVVRAVSAAADLQTAIDQAVGRLEERLRRVGERRHDHRNSHGHGKDGPPLATPAFEVAAVEAAVPGASVAGAAAPEPRLPPDVVYADGPVLVREKTHRTTPMTVVDALDALEAVGHDFYLFEDSATGQASVVYRRRGYDYGVIRLDVAR